jgi:hypothetical protein
MFMCVNAHSPLMSQNNEKKANTEHGPMDGQRLAATQALRTVWWLERVGLRADPETGGAHCSRTQSALDLASIQLAAAANTVTTKAIARG